MAKFEHVAETPPLFWIALVETNKLEKPARVRACSMVVNVVVGGYTGKSNLWGKPWRRTIVAS